MISPQIGPLFVVPISTLIHHDHKKNAGESIIPRMFAEKIKSLKAYVLALLSQCYNQW